MNVQAVIAWALTFEQSALCYILKKKYEKPLAAQKNGTNLYSNLQF